MLKRWRKSEAPKQPAAIVIDTIVRVDKNDVIIIRSNDLSAMPDEEFSDFIASVHAHFPESLVILMEADSTFEAQGIETVRQMLEDLIAHQDALDQKGSS